MIKKIKLRDKVVLYNTETQEGFDEVFKFFERKIKTMVSYWATHIPHHDEDDLAQVCHMKLVDGLDKYDDKKNIYFSTFIYKIWKNRLSQLSYKYRTKKYSRDIDNDHYVSFNYSFDKLSNSFYLMLNKHKCPISREVIDNKTCKGCPHHFAYKKKKVSRGKEVGESKSYTMCQYLKQVLDQRGTTTISLDAPLQLDGNGGSGEVSRHETFSSKKDDFRDIHFKMDLERIKEKVMASKDAINIDKTSFIILELLVEGLNRSEIIKKLNIDANQFSRSVKKLEENKDLAKLVR